MKTARGLFQGGIILTALLVLATFRASGAETGGGALPSPAGGANSPGILNVRDFGATGDGKTTDTAALQRAIEACAKRGGGTVYFPAGTYLSGSLTLKSCVTLNLDAGATLLGSQNFRDYPVIEGRWEGQIVREHAALIFGQDLERIAIAGRGTIDGQGDPWWRAVRAASASRRPAPRGPVRGPAAPPARTPAPTPAAKAAAATSATAAGETPARPRLINLINCRNIQIQGVTLQNSPAWTIHPVFCDNVVVDGVTINNPSNSPNTDGINPDSCSNVRIANCLLSCGDDCITLKSGKDEEGRRIGRPIENVTITNCVMLRGHGGVVIGSEMSGGAHDITISNCVFRGTDTGIRMKSARGRGGIVENITVSNIAMHSIVREAIIMTMAYTGVTSPEPVTDRTPTFRNITLSNIRVNGAQSAASITGIEEKPLEGLVIANYDARTSGGMALQYVKGLDLERVSLRPSRGTVLKVTDCADVTLNGVKPYAPDAAAPAILLSRVSDVRLHGCVATPGTGTFLKVNGKGTGTAAGAQEEPREIQLNDNDLAAAGKAIEN